MVTLFAPGIPIQDSQVKSAEIRNNFDALYDKIKTLEPRALSPEGVGVLILGGPVYFRGSDAILYDEFLNPISGKLSLIRFNDTIINLKTNNGYKTIKNPDGTLSRQEIIGISPFPSINTFKEVMISLNFQGRLVFTEGATVSTSPISKPYEIAFDDKEIPICLITLQQSGSLSEFRNISQVDIVDIRPVITTAFQNNLDTGTLQSVVSDNANRIKLLEQKKADDRLKVRVVLPEQLELDNTKTTNKKVEILSGNCYIDRKLVKYPGGFIDITTSMAPTNANYYNLAVLALNTSGGIEVTHGVSHSNQYLVQYPATYLDGGVFSPPSAKIPLAIVRYRAANSSGTQDIKPIVSEIFADPSFDVNGNVTTGFRFNYDLSIVEFISSIEFVIEIPLDIVSPATLLTVGNEIDLFDSNTRPFRCTITQLGTYNSSTKTQNVQVNRTFINTLSSPNSINGLSLNSSPKCRNISTHLDIVEDVRPFAQME